MPRVNSVDKCRKDQGKCEKCGAEIKAGSAYKWWQFAFSPTKHKRCSKPECAPKASDLTQSAFLGQLYELQERSFDGCETIDDLESQKEDIKSELESLKEECESNRENIPDQLKDANAGTLLQERIDALEEACNELDNVDISCDAMDNEPEEPDEPERNEGESDEDFAARQKEYEEAKKKYDEEHDAWESEVKDRVAEIASELNDVLGNISCG